MPPKVTVLMSVYNEERYLREAIESILNQTYSDFEFLIINDASTDNSLCILHEYHDERIKIINNIQNLGLTKSLNIGIQKSDGKYIARMDADDISYPERLEKQIDFLEEHPEIPLVGTSVEIIDEFGNFKYFQIMKTSPTFKDFLRSHCVIHGSVIFKKEIFNEFVGYNELFKKCQDYALWLQISQKYQINNLEEILYKFRISSQAVTRVNNESIYYHIMAVRYAKDMLSSDSIKKIQSYSVISLHEELSNEELIFFHSSMAERYRIQGNFELASKQYLEVLSKSPFNIQYWFQLFRLFFGKKFVDLTDRIYFHFHNYFILKY